MALIRCGGCRAIHESTLAACPACGRCPGCGARQAEAAAKGPGCPDCRAPYCPCCGRCPACGSLRTVALPPCPCGHPSDPDRLARVEATFRWDGR